MKVSGAELRDERVRAGVSNVALAGAMGVNPSTVTRIEQAIEVRAKSASQFRDGLRRLADQRARSEESVRVAAQTLISAGESLIETGRQLAGTGVDV